MAPEAVDSTDFVDRSELPVVLPGQRTTVWPAEARGTDGSTDAMNLSAATEPSDLSIAGPPRIPTLPPLAYRFDLRQQWEGTVLAVGQNEFRARLKDLTEPGSLPEEATFSTEEVSLGDLRRLAPGAVFRWSIGYKTQGSQKERVSRIHFVRLPGWSKRAVERVEAEAAELQRLFSDTNSIT